jgi:transcriptional regulator with XRE-family HTH domain
LPLLKFIAARLRELRQKHELTQEQMALLLGTDLKWYQRVEWRKKDVRASTIERLAAVFGITSLEFLGKELPKTKVASRPPGAPHKQRIRSKRKASR